MSRQAAQPTKADTLNSEDYQRAFSKERARINARWEGANEPVIKGSQMEWKQIKTLLEAHMLKVLGKEYTVGRFTEKDIGSREALGYAVLTMAFFPRDGENKETWTDSIARSMKLQNHVDGTIRWGSRNELLVCIIPTNFREFIKKQDKDNAEVLMNRHLGKGKKVSTDSSGREVEMEEVELSKELSPKLIRRN